MTGKDGIEPFFAASDLAQTGEAYFAGQDPLQPLLAPAVLGDTTGFPAILLQVGTVELLLDDSVRLAERARDADVDVVLDVTAGVPHVLQAWTASRSRCRARLRRALPPPAPRVT